MTSHEEIHAGKAPGKSTGHDGAEAPHKLPMRTLIAASDGNAVEWYDWTVYATFSIYPAGERVAGAHRHIRYLRPRLLLPPARWLPAGSLR